MHAGQCLCEHIMTIYTMHCMQPFQIFCQEHPIPSDEESCQDTGLAVLEKPNLIRHVGHSFSPAKPLTCKKLSIIGQGHQR